MSILEKYSAAIKDKDEAAMMSFCMMILNSQCINQVILW